MIVHVYDMGRKGKSVFQSEPELTMFSNHVRKTSMSLQHVDIFFSGSRAMPGGIFQIFPGHS